MLFAGAFSLYAMPASAQHMFTRNVTLCAVDMNFADLVGFIDRIREFHKNANRDFQHSRMREKLTLEDKITKLELTTDISVKALEQGPKIAARLWYYMSRHDDAPISNIDLTFSDYERKLTIAGTDRDLVNGLSLMVEEEIKKTGCSFGGSDTRRDYGYILWVLALTISWLPLILAKFSRFVAAGTRLQVFVLSICVGTSLGLFICIFALPWADWFPGTAIRKHSISTWDQISPYLTILSFSVGLAGLAFSMDRVFSRRSEDRGN